MTIVMSIRVHPYKATHFENLKSIGWPAVSECSGLSRNRGCVSRVLGRNNPGPLSRNRKHSADSGKRTPLFSSRRHEVNV